MNRVYLILQISKGNKLKIIDAYWEKRNLGCSSIEITVDKTDTLDDLKEALSTLKEPEYVVFKVPSGGVEFLEYLTDNGFYFMETVSEIHLDINSFNIPSKFVRFNETLKYKTLTLDSLDALGCEIKKGIFNTDRISLDARFGIGIAANRYFNWIEDEMSRGNNIYEILYKQEGIGFFGIKQITDDTFDNFLAAMFTGKPYFGFGFSTITKSIEEIIARKGKYLVTHVSSNNMPVIRLYSQLGFTINSMTYIMIKHFS